MSNFSINFILYYILSADMYVKSHLKGSGGEEFKELFGKSVNYLW